MKKTLLTICWIFLMLVPATGQSTDQTIDDVMERTVSDFVRPGYEAFGNSTSEMSETVERLCKAPGQETLQSARAAFTATAKSWADIELIRFGPISRENRFERILFYPDRKSTGLKQVQRILAKQDDSATDLNRITGKSVAVQGLGALEFLLFGTGSEMLVSGDKFRCSYAATVSQNLAKIASILIDGWQANGDATKTWTVPGPDNPVLRSPKEAVNELLGTLVHGLESIRDLRIGAFLRKETSKDRPRVAIFRRSENTMTMIAANIAAIKRLLLQSGAQSLLSPEDGPIFDNIIFELENAERVANAIPEPLGNSITEPEHRDRLVYLRTSVGFAIGMLDQDFAAAAGLSSGFSFSDGD
ncbi:MAG: imelysin family protein [Pseudomonadota bacterium]